MAIRRRLERKPKKIRYEDEVEEADVVDVTDPQDDDIPEFDAPEPEKHSVRKIVPPPTKKPVLYHKRVIQPESSEESVVSTPLAQGVPTTDVSGIKPVQAKKQTSDITIPQVDSATLVALLERVVTVQEDIVACIKTLATRPGSNIEVTAEIIPPTKPSESVKPKPEPKIEKEEPTKVKSSGQAGKTGFGSYSEWNEWWKGLTFEEKVEEAKSQGITWKEHESQRRENINLTMAYKRSMGIKKD